MPRLLSVPEGKVKKPLLVVIVTDGKPVRYLLLPGALPLHLTTHRLRLSRS